LIVTGAAGAARLPAAVRARAELLVAGEDAVDLPAALRALRVARGVRWLLCEGGPRLAHALLASGAVDELFLTLAPRLVAGEEPALLVGPPLRPARPLTLLTIHEHAGELFLRYRVGAGSG
jgi:riboflavin biosynthesis pyrimidine reductase